MRPFAAEFVLLYHFVVVSRTVSSTKSSDACDAYLRSAQQRQNWLSNGGPTRKHPRHNQSMVALREALPEHTASAQVSLYDWAINVYGLADTAAALQKRGRSLAGLPGSLLHPPAVRPERVALVTAGMLRTFTSDKVWSSQQQHIVDQLRSFGHMVDHYLCAEWDAVRPPPPAARPRVVQRNDRTT